MNLDSEDLVHQFAQDWPDQFERSRLFLLVTKLTEENDRLRALIPQEPLNQTSVMPSPTFTATARSAPYLPPLPDDDGNRHGG